MILHRNLIFLLQIIYSFVAILKNIFLTHFSSGFWIIRLFFGIYRRKDKISHCLTSHIDGAGSPASCNGASLWRIFGPGKNFADFRRSKFRDFSLWAILAAEQAHYQAADWYLYKMVRLRTRCARLKEI